MAYCMLSCTSCSLVMMNVVLVQHHNVLIIVCSLHPIYRVFLKLFCFLYGVYYMNFHKFRRTERRKLSSSDAKFPKCFVWIWIDKCLKRPFSDDLKALIFNFYLARRRPRPIRITHRCLRKKLRPKFSQTAFLHPYKPFQENRIIKHHCCLF